MGVKNGRRHRQLCGCYLDIVHVRNIALGVVFTAPCRLFRSGAVFGTFGLGRQLMAVFGLPEKSSALEFSPTEVLADHNS